MQQCSTLFRRAAASLVHYVHRVTSENVSAIRDTIQCSRDSHRNDMSQTDFTMKSSRYGNWQPRQSHDHSGPEHNIRSHVAVTLQSRKKHETHQRGVISSERFCENNSPFAIIVKMRLFPLLAVVFAACCLPAQATRGTKNKGAGKRSKAVSSTSVIGASVGSDFPSLVPSLVPSISPVIATKGAKDGKQKSFKVSAPTIKGDNKRYLGLFRYGGL